MNEQTEFRVRSALLRGDRNAVFGFARSESPQTMSTIRSAVLREETQAFLLGKAPFCRLVSVCQGALGLSEDAGKPFVCCGGLEGSTSPATHGMMVMLLRGWGIPFLDLGLDNSTDRFLDAVEACSLSCVVCTAFMEQEALAVRELDREARRRGVRSRFRLLLSGSSVKDVLPVDNADFRAAAVAEEVAVLCGK